MLLGGPRQAINLSEAKGFSPVTWGQWSHALSQAYVKIWGAAYWDTVTLPIGEEGQVGNIGVRGWSEPRVHSVTPLQPSLAPGGQGTVGSTDLGFLGGSPLSFGENSQSLPLAFFFFFCLIFSLPSFWDSNYTYVRPFDHVSVPAVLCPVFHSVFSWET